MIAIRSLPILLTCLLTAGSTGAADEGTVPVLGLRDRTPRITAFVGATVVVSPERTVEDAVLVLRDGRVAAVGTDVHPPADARVIDARGFRIYPGFVDPLTEYGLQPTGGDRPPPGEGRSSAPDYVGQRVGLDAWNDAIHAEIDWVDRFRPDAEAAKQFLARGVTAVQSARLDGILRGRAFVATLDADDEPGRVVLEPASLQMASFDKGSSSQAYPSSLMGSIALLRQAFLDAAWYRRASEAWRRDRSQQEPERNRALEALAANERPIVFETTDELSLLRAGRISAEFDVRLIHVGSNMEFEWLDQVAALGQPIILPLDFPERPDVASADAALDVDLGRLRRWERAPHNAAVLAGAGVQIAFTGHGLGPKDDMLAALRRTIEGGLDEATALAALTVVPAGMCGVGDLVGTLEPGHRADLIVADGDLLTDDRSRIRTVWIGGVETASFVPLDQADFRGVWSVELAGHAAELTLSGKIDAPKGRLAAGEAKARIGEVDSGRRTLRFRASLEPFGAEGIGRFVLDSADAGVTGTVSLPGDRRAALTLTRTGDAPRKDDDDEDAQGAEADDGPVGRLTHPDVAYGLVEPIPRQDVLVRNATVWALEGEGRLDGADLLVHDGRIAAVGRGLDAPAGIRVIDATGKHVTPGIIDEHSHLAISRGVNEGSHAVTAEVRIGDVVNADDIGIYRALAGGVTTAQLLHGSANPIGGQSQIIKMRWGSPPEALKFSGAPPSIKFALGENVKQSNWGERFRTRYPQSRMGVETIMRDAFLAAREYRQAGERWNALSARQRERTVPPRRDLRLDTLLEILDGKRFVHCHSYRQSEILMLMRLAESLGWRVQTFTHILEGYKIAPEMAAHGAGGSSFADWWAYKYEVYDAIPYNTCLMHDAGVVTSINSDSAEAIRRLNQEAGKAVMYCGMDQVEALKLATLNPAIQLRIDDRVGSLAPGKDADFVIWSGPPLSVLSRVEQTWVDGAPLFDIERDAAERTAIAEEREALVQKALRAAGRGGRRGDRGAEREPEWHCDDVEDVWHEQH